MNKPLTKEEREYIANVGAPEHDESNFSVALGYAMKAEAYWREAVKKLPEVTLDLVDDADYPQHKYPCGGTHLGVWGGEESCLFCGASLAGQQVCHKPDCPWKLAQE